MNLISNVINLRKYSYYGIDEWFKPWLTVAIMFNGVARARRN